MRRTEHILRTDEQRQALWSRLRRLPLDKPLKVTVERYRERRSLKQNAVHWKRLNDMVQDLAEETGHTADELHEAFKADFCPAKPVVVNGVEYQVKSTKLLNTAEMHDFMERVCAHCAEVWGYEMFEPIPRHVTEDTT